MFSYYEYTGDDFAVDMAKKVELQVSQDWQKATGEYREMMSEDKRFLELEEIWHEDFEN